MPLIKNIGQATWRLLACNPPEGYDLEVVRKLILLNLLYTTGTISLFSLGVLALLQGHVVLFAADFFVGLCTVGMLVSMWKSKDPRLVSAIGVGLIFVFFLFIVANGGVNQTTFVWCFTFPPLAVFLHGTKKGGGLSLAFLLALGAVFAAGFRYPSISRYAPDLITRFIASYITELVMVLAFETARAEFQRRLVSANVKLQNSLEEIKTLSGLLPICASCKKIRDDKGYWTQIEAYIQAHSAAQFSHSICEECADELYGSEDWYQEMKRERESTSS